MSLHFAETLKKLRKEKGLTQEKLGEQFNITKTGVSYWESNRSEPSLKMINELAEYFDVDTSYLIGGSETFQVQEESVSYNSTKTFKLPYYLNLSAGCFDEVIEEPNNFVDVPNEFLRKRKNLIAFKINGDSMNKVIPNNSIIVIEKKEKFKSGDIVVAQTDEGCTLKKYQISGENLILIPESKNPEFYPMAFTKDDFVKILGKVVWYYPPYDVFE